MDDATWLRHQMETYSALLALFVTGGLPSQRPVRQSFYFIMCAWTNCCANSTDAGDLWHHDAHCDVVVVILFPEEYNRTHSKCTTFLESFNKCIPLTIAREGSSSWQPLWNNNTAGGKQSARVNIKLFPDVSSTLHSQNEWFNISRSDIYL